MMKRLTAEFIGTLWLVLGGCGSAMYAAAFPEVGIGLLGVSFAFGLTVLTMAYAVGGISGGHFNPAVTLGLVAAGRHSAGDAVPYIIAQVLGAIAAVVILHIVASGTAGFDVATATYAANGYGEQSPGAYNMGSAFVMEAVMTFFFLIIIIGVTHPKVPAGFAPIAIGLGLTLIHLISIPVTNTSVNPARSTGPAIFAGGEYLGQLWLFWVSPIVGGVLAGLVSRWLKPDED
ncbi:MAG: aquaporin Z [Rhodospirillales bacterium]